MQKPLTVVPIPPPPPEQRVRRQARFAQARERKTRYHLPEALDSASPIGFRTRTSLTQDEAQAALALFSLSPPTDFAEPGPLTDQELFEESALGVLSARQSTNYRGHRQVTFGPERSAEIAEILRSLHPAGQTVLDRAAYTHVALTRPYRTAFTLLLTFVGHQPLLNLVTVPLRAWRKRFQHRDDIPTIGYLQQLHLGIWADALERAVVLASAGRRRALVHLAPFTSASRREKNAPALRRLEELCGLDEGLRAKGWRVGFVAQVGESKVEERLALEPGLCRKLGATLLALRSERIQPGVNAEESAPSQYQTRQVMDVPEELREQAGRAAYNAFARWLPIHREHAKDVMLLDRVDVLSPGGKERLRAIRKGLAEVTDQVVTSIPLWADLPTGRALSRNAARGKKAFALAGQRIYIGGLSRPEIEKAGLDWDQAVIATGAAAARSALYAELMGCVDLPPDCDLLAGVCLMAGPVNQNDIGKTFFGHEDLLAPTFGERSPTSLLVWTVKAKTIADPIGNEEQLLNADRKGALVDLRPGPHEVVWVEVGGRVVPFRFRDGQTSRERAFADQQNFVTDPDGRPIEGNAGEPWPWGADALFPGSAPST